MIGAALVAGTVAGFAGSVPVSGPISAMAFRQGLAGAYGDGLRVALGGALAKGIYAGLAVYGAGELLAQWPAAAAGLERFGPWLGALLLGVLGVGLLVSGPRALRLPDGRAPGVATGFVVTMCNPTVLATFGLVAGLLRANGLALDGAGAALAFGVGAALGMTGWFSLLMELLRRTRRALGERGRRWLSRAMGVLLLGLAASCVWGALAG